MKDPKVIRWQDADQAFSAAFRDLIIAAVVDACRNGAIFFRMAPEATQIAILRHCVGLLITREKDATADLLAALAADLRGTDTEADQAAAFRRIAEAANLANTPASGSA